ncbi:MAG TPA: lytic transglycosylase [Treponema sp.]|nr:lytic transglycosylase [Treponema sp.]
MTLKRIFSLLASTLFFLSLAVSQSIEEPVLLTEDDFLELIESLSQDIVEAEEVQTEEPVQDELLTEVEAKEINRKPLDIEGVDHALCQRFHNQYLTAHGRQQLVQALIDSAPYRPYIRQKLEEAGLPSVIQYLPIVESNYRIRAVSRSGAIGLWQFMENSMSPFLTKNAWYDERYDPWKSTDAAIAKLKDNYQMFNDWALALAAYNCGAGAMRRILSRNKGKDFWYLAEHNLLSQQSALYVPKLLAIADLVENAEYYGLDDVTKANHLIDGTAIESFDYVTVAGMFSINQIANLTGIDKETVTRLNPALFRNCTPAGAKYQLRLPAGKAEEAEEALKDAGVATDALIYTVSQGDTLWGISRKYGVTVADLCEVNNIKENGILSIGQKVIVPIFK